MTTMLAWIEERSTLAREQQSNDWDRPWLSFVPPLLILLVIFALFQRQEMVA